MLKTIFLLKTIVSKTNIFVRQKSKNGKFAEDKKTLTADFLLVILVAGWGSIKNNDNDWKFQSYKGTNLGDDMLCESVNSDQEEK